MNKKEVIPFSPVNNALHFPCLQMCYAVKFRRLRKILIQVFHLEVFLKAYESFLRLNLTSKASAVVSVCHCKKELKCCTSKILEWCFFLSPQTHFLLRSMMVEQPIKKGEEEWHLHFVHMMWIAAFQDEFICFFPLSNLRDLLQKYQNVVHFFLIFLLFYYRFGCRFLAMEICILWY